MRNNLLLPMLRRRFEPTRPFPLLIIISLDSVNIGSSFVFTVDHITDTVDEANINTVFSSTVSL